MIPIAIRWTDFFLPTVAVDTQYTFALFSHLVSQISESWATECEDGKGMTVGVSVYEERTEAKRTVKTTTSMFRSPIVRDLTLVVIPVPLVVLERTAVLFHPWLVRLGSRDRHMSGQQSLL